MVLLAMIRLAVGSRLNDLWTSEPASMADIAECREKSPAAQQRISATGPLHQLTEDRYPTAADSGGLEAPLVARSQKQPSPQA